MKSDHFDVTFEIVEGDPAVTVLTPTYNANSKQDIIFRFTAVDTPLSNGRVGFSIPRDWTPFTKKTGADDKGKVKCD